MTKTNGLAALGVVILLAIVGNGYLSLHVNAKLSHDEQAQLLNRATNVEAWCSGINSGRDYDRGFVARVSHGFAVYSLGDLPCRALVAKTLASGSGRQPKITLALHPLVYSALHP